MFLHLLSSVELAGANSCCDRAVNWGRALGLPE